MKKYLIWFFMLMKRTVKIPSFALMLIVIFIFAIAVPKLEQGEKSEVAAGIMIKDNGENGNNEENARGDCKEWNMRFVSQINGYGGSIKFYVYENEEMMTQAVKRGELNCAFILPDDLRSRIEEGRWRDSITVYSASASAVTQIAKERIAAEVFKLYSEESYVNYIKESSFFGAEGAGGNDRDEIVEFAQAAYETHLADGSTFDVIYNMDDRDGQENGRDSQANAVDSQDAINNADADENGRQGAEGTFRLRSVLAVCIFISGMCGLLTDQKDRQTKRFCRIVPEYVTTLANIWIPVIYTSIVSFAVLVCTNRICGFEDIMKELCRLMFYQFLIVIYCSIIGSVFKKQEIIAAAIPIFTLASVICCPVFIRLAVYIPVFRVLEKLFPVTYYLL